MLTSLIEQYADIGGLSSPDINLKVLLRHNIVPAYMADVGFVAWRRSFGTIALVQGTVAYDLPTGGRRLIQRADGYTATIVAGEVTYRDGTPTGALPGRLLRGAQAAPAAMAAE